MASSNFAFQSSFTENTYYDRLTEQDDHFTLRRSPRLAAEQNKETIGARRTKKWCEVSVQDVSQVFREVKETANKTLRQMRCSVGSLPEKLRRSTRRRQFGQLHNINTPDKTHIEMKKTPVRMYSPFNADTPGGRKSIWNAETSGKLKPKRFEFSSPTGKLKKDVTALKAGINELQELERGLQLRMSRR